MTNYIKPKTAFVELELGDNILDPTGMYSSGAGDDLVKGEKEWENEEGGIDFSSTSLWDEEW